MTTTELLASYEHTSFSYEGKRRDIFRKGSGPAVIVIAEMPGITPKVIEFADRVVGIGCTAILPHLFGRPGYDIGVANKLQIAGYMMSSVAPVCVSKEFTMLATGKTSPVVNWLRGLAASEHDRCGGPGVGCIGMCFTGGFALAMATDDRLLAPVLSQPSMPVGLSKRARRSIDISPKDLDRVKQRCANGLEVLGLRFRGDKIAPAERFEFLREQLGAAFVAVELNDEDANPNAFMKKPHSVLTEHLIDEPGQPTRNALEQVLEHFRSRLLPDG